MKRIMLAVLALAVATGAFAQLSGTFTWGGSTTVAPIAYAAIEQFQKDNTGVKISYEATGSGAGLTSLLKGQYSLAGSSAVVSDDQKKQGAFPIAIAYDGISIVVNKNVKLSNISMGNLAKVYAGQITNWKDLGGQDMQIVVVNRDEASGTYGSFNDLVLKPVKLSYTKNAIVTKENGEVAAKVASTPGSIGYVGFAFADVHDAGAAIVHIHARNDDGSPTWSKDTFARIMAETKQRSPVLINWSTGGAGTLSSAVSLFRCPRPATSTAAR